ncbi:MAG: PorV/PorQ family protein [bacterium]|nr:PorV/PorQ family protein [bacterium]
MTKMEKVKMILIITIIGSFLSQICCAKDETHKDAGTASATFLEFGIGGKAVAMGEAYMAVSSDVTAIYWNPGGLSQVKGKEFAAMHNIWFEDISHDFLGYAHPIGKDKIIGIGIIGLFINDLERRKGPNLEKEGTFGAYDGSIILSYSQNVSKNFSAGFSLKGIYQQIDREKGQGAALDIGWLYKIPIKNLNLGFAIQNWGSKMKIYKRKFQLPRIFRIGASYRPFKNNLTLAFDVSKSIDNGLILHFGTEYQIFDLIAIRGGYRYKLDQIDNEPLSGLTAGLGFKIKDYQLDYAFVPYSDLGDTHRISFLLKFGPSS